MSRWIVNYVSSMVSALEKNHWLEMGRETQSDINFLCAGDTSGIVDFLLLQLSYKSREMCRTA